MRYSSVKTTVAALTIAVSLLAAVPTAEARANRETRSSREAGYENDRVAAVKRFVQRALRRLGVNSGPGVPIPEEIPGTTGSNPT